MTNHEANLYLDHPEFVKLTKTAPNTKDLNRIIAFNVYLDLCETKSRWNVELKYADCIDQIYLMTKSSETDSPEAIVPIGENGSLTPSDMRRILAYLTKTECADSFTLAMYGNVIVYYKIYDGLVFPPAKRVNETSC